MLSGERTGEKRDGLTDVLAGGPTLQVPHDPARRRQLADAAATYADRERLEPPLTAEELAAHARCLGAAIAACDDELPFVALLLNNMLWREVIAGIPFDRRLLLLPQCLAHAEVCRADRDGLGLLCAQCGACAIGALQAEADRLGYVTLIAEGTTVVSKLLMSGKVDAVIGVGCMESLRRIFPVMNTHAIPGQGIPLLTDGCVRTTLDIDWALESLRIRRAEAKNGATDLDAVAAVVRQWFEPESLAVLMGRPETEAQRVGQAWLATGGKRWRPLLTAAVYEAAGGDIERIKAAAVAVECFHKASLVHDDIEDGDVERYGEPTVHAQVGVPAAINVGDYLIGEGYRLLASSEFDGAVCAEMLLAAANGHRELCLGQGEELAFCRKPAPVTEAEVLRIYAQKTAAAFEVAVQVGATAAGVGAETRALLSAFSQAVGTAYQIQDDIADFHSVRGRAADMLAMRPTLFLAAACTSEHPAVREALKAVWQGDAAGRERLIDAITEAGLRTRVDLLYAHYKHETTRVLSDIPHSGLKRLLRRIVKRMLR